MSKLPDTTGIPHAKLRKVIDKVRNRIKKHPTVKKMFKDFKVDLNELDNVPMCFAKTSVSARTDHCIIYFNIKLLEDGDFENDDHYMVHELTHWLQQSTGNKPTQGADDGEYLDNQDEVEGFQNQTEYISDVKGDEKAKEYVAQVLDHHKIDDSKERMKKFKELLGE